ncbi:hypothetical protein [Diaphorobacter aerolatus]|uniref:hypothetical protein n=1 Tax=Diaphorobacter aerolatus TaxID=1288495 RepID=UPI001D01FE9C|nr:hypothetical protein [Diaphorobacter aerolatus]
MHFTQLVGHAGIEQDTLGGSGLAGVDVRGNANIAIALDGVLRAMMNPWVRSLFFRTAFAYASDRPVFKGPQSTQGRSMNYTLAAFIVSGDEPLMTSDQ